MMRRREDDPFDPEDTLVAMRDRLLADIDDAERKAWDALGRYKFQMFGYWVAVWVHLNRVGRFKRPNPWKALVLSARRSRGAS